MHHAFKICGITHYHNHQVLIRFYFQIPQLSFSSGFLQQNKNSQQVIWCFHGEYKHIQNVYQKTIQSQTIRTKLTEFWEIFWSGYLSLYATYSSFRLFNSRCFCMWTLLPMLKKSFPLGIILKNSVSLENNWTESKTCWKRFLPFFFSERERIPLFTFSMCASGTMDILIHWSTWKPSYNTNFLKPVSSFRFSHQFSYFHLQVLLS